MAQIERNNAGNASSDPKNWLVYLDGGYSSPLSQSDIIKKIQMGELNREVFLWKEGLTDWKQAKEFEEFIPFLDWNSHRIPWQKVPNIQESGPFVGNKAAIINNAVNLKSTPNSLEFQEEAVAEKPVDSNIALEPILETPKFFKKRSQLVLAVSASAILLIVTALNLISQNMNRFSTNLPELTRDELREIKSAVQEPLSGHGPNAVLVKSSADAEASRFYVGTNLPNGTKLDLIFEGIPESLVGQFTLSQTTTLTVQNGVARTPLLFQSNHLPFPIGEYWIKVLRPDGNEKPLTQKKFFIGSVSEQEYRLKLHNYHLSLQSKARSELEELGQIASTEEDLLNETLDQFENSTAALWIPFQAKWLKIQAQVRNLIPDPKRPLAELPENAIYYADLYALGQQLISLVDVIHDAHNVAKAEKRTNLSSNDHKEKISLARSTILALKARVEILSRTPQTAGGLPPR